MAINIILFADGREVTLKVELVMPPLEAGYLLPDFIILHALAFLRTSFSVMLLHG
jgi:hypothetical protein